LRRACEAVTNFYFWNMTFTPGFTQWPPRSLTAYLTADF
jgi:hypothetical protein